MTYLDDSDLYRDDTFHRRAEMCTREQGYIFSADGRPDIASLGRSVVANDYEDIEAVVVATVSAPGSNDLLVDEGLLAAVQAIWPTVAAARYPQA